MPEHVCRWVVPALKQRTWLTNVRLYAEVVKQMQLICYAEITYSIPAVPQHIIVSVCDQQLLWNSPLQLGRKPQPAVSVRGRQCLWSVQWQGHNSLA